MGKRIAAAGFSAVGLLLIVCGNSQAGENKLGVCLMLICVAAAGATAGWHVTEPE